MLRGSGFLHCMQLFDDAGSLGASVAGFVREGLMQGESVLVVATQSHWTAIDARLQESQADLEQYRDSLSS